MHLNKYFTLALFAFVVLSSCKERPNTPPDSADTTTAEKSSVRGNSVVRDRLAFISRLKIEVAFSDVEPLLLKEGFAVTRATGGQYVYVKKDDTWHMEVDMTIPNDKIEKMHLKVSSNNNQVSRDEIFDSLAALFQASFGEANQKGMGTNEGDKYEEYTLYDESGGITYLLRINNGQVEVTIEAFGF